MAAAAALTNSVTDQLKELRSSSEQWEDIWMKVTAMCTENVIALESTDNANNTDSIRRPSRSSKMPGRLQDYFTMETVGARHHNSEAIQTSSEDVTLSTEDFDGGQKNSCRVSVFIVMIDNVLSEMNKRFGPLQNSFYSAIQALLPTSPRFLSHTTIEPLITHYSDFLFPEVLPHVLLIRNSVVRRTSRQN